MAGKHHMKNAFLIKLETKLINCCLLQYSVTILFNKKLIFAKNMKTLIKPWRSSIDIAVSDKQWLFNNFLAFLPIWLFDPRLNSTFSISSSFFCSCLCTLTSMFAFPSFSFILSSLCLSFSSLVDILLFLKFRFIFLWNFLENRPFTSSKRTMQAEKVKEKEWRVNLTIIWISWWGVWAIIREGKIWEISEISGKSMWRDIKTMSYLIYEDQITKSAERRKTALSIIRSDNRYKMVTLLFYRKFKITLECSSKNDFWQ